MYLQDGARQSSHGVHPLCVSGQRRYINQILSLQCEMKCYWLQDYPLSRVPKGSLNHGLVVSSRIAVMEGNNFGQTF